MSACISCWSLHSGTSDCILPDFACVPVYLTKGVTAVMQQSIQHQNCINRKGFKQAKAVCKLLSSGQALRSAAQVLLIQLSSAFSIGEIALEHAQQGPDFVAVGGCALLSLEETQV